MYNFTNLSFFLEYVTHGQFSYWIDNLLPSELPNISATQALIALLFFSIIQVFSMATGLRIPTTALITRILSILGIDVEGFVEEMETENFCRYIPALILYLYLLVNRITPDMGLGELNLVQIIFDPDIFALNFLLNMVTYFCSLATPISNEMLIDVYRFQLIEAIDLITEVHPLPAETNATTHTDIGLAFLIASYLGVAGGVLVAVLLPFFEVNCLDLTTIFN